MSLSRHINNDGMNQTVTVFLSSCSWVKNHAYSQYIFHMTLLNQHIMKSDAASGMATYNIRRKKRIFYLLFRVKKGKFVFYSLKKMV